MKFKNDKGVTMFSLVITIVVTIMLAGITISATFSNGDGAISESKKFVKEKGSSVLNVETQINSLYDNLIGE